MWQSNGTPNVVYGTGTNNPPVWLYLTTFLWANSAVTGSTSPPTVPFSYLRINGDKTNTTATDITHARPASMHPGVAVFAFCDGHQKTISEDIGYRVYKQLMTPYGGNTGVVSAALVGSGDIDSYNTILSDSY